MEDVTTQLRIYTINRGRLDDFVAAWRSGVFPLRTRLGFTISQAWMIRERNEFIWVISHPGPEPWEDVERAYYGSAERAALDPDPAQFIARAEQWFVTPILV